MRDIAFGQYYPSNSPLHRLDARAKLLFSLFYMVGIFFVYSYVSFSIVFALLVFIIAIGKLPILTILKSIKPMLFIMFFAIILNIFFYKQGRVLAQWGKVVIYMEGLHFAIQMALRLMFLVIGTAVLTLTTTPTELTDAIESLLKPLTYLKFPVHDIAVIMALALRFVPGFIDETNKIIMAQKARGASFDTGSIFARAKAMIPVLIPLFVNAFKKADDLADALDARCYNATPNRTKMKKLKFTYRDIIALIILLGVFIVIFLDPKYIDFVKYDNQLQDLILKAAGR